MKNLSKIYRGLIYILPGVLFLSYYPVMKLGTSGAMNFELSLPLCWLVLFDIVGFVIMVKQRLLFCNFQKKWIWLLLPGFLTISILWSANVLRGILTVGILWLIYFAVEIMFSLKNELKTNGFREKFWKVFFGSTLVVCAWCFLQCILDLAGVPRECSLMCEGCTYRSFGFPHPNGFAIEPQFMGNLLLAPAIVLAFITFFRIKKSYYLILFVIIATLFLTFSRGAIYAFIVGVIFMTGFVVGYAKRGWKKIAKRTTMVWLVMVLAFLFTLNLQGVMAAVSPTNDTYFSGISKALNHLSLGVIDIRKNDVDSGKIYTPASGLTEEEYEDSKKEVVEKPVKNFVEKEEDSYFDGYVAESTETRLKMNEVALKLWMKDAKTMLLGVGLGGAGQALYDNGLTDWPKEIVQNQYVSLLLETGLIGMMFLVLALVLAIRTVVSMRIKNTDIMTKKSEIVTSPKGVILALIIAYGISLMFFAGLPNVLQVYLMPAVTMLLL